MNKQQIKELALANGFKLKQQPDGTLDLNPYVYEFAAALAAEAELVAQVERLRRALNDQLNDCINFDGGKLTDIIMRKSAEVLLETPQQHLRDIQAEAGRAGYLACAKEYGTARLNGSEQGIKRHAELYSLAIRYSVNEAMLGVAVTWLLDNRFKKPQFSVACGLVFNDNEDAEDFDSHMSEVALDYDMHVSSNDVVKLFVVADQYAERVKRGEA